MIKLHVTDRIFSARLPGANVSHFQSYIFGELHCEAVLLVATPWEFHIYADETTSTILRRIQGQGIEVAVADVASVATIAATMGAADLDQFCHHLLHHDLEPWLEGPRLFSDELESSSIILPLVKAFSAFLRLPVDRVQTVQLFRKPSLSRFDPLPLAYSSYERFGEDLYNMRDDP
ncbi:hypothetical protein BT69DRAFT_1298264 [Atractiella rhizophila]|nr:hypothetical protein BT69DRAFT_1298264 [Atractiella rhizophila]